MLEGMEDDWRRVLDDRLAEDDDFRAWFERQPGQAAASIGVPFEVVRARWAEVAKDYEID